VYHLRREERIGKESHFGVLRPLESDIFIEENNMTSTQTIIEQLPGKDAVMRINILSEICGNCHGESGQSGSLSAYRRHKVGEEDGF